MPVVVTRSLCASSQRIVRILKYNVTQHYMCFVSTVSILVAVRRIRTGPVRHGIK